MPWLGLKLVLNSKHHLHTRQSYGQKKTSQNQQYCEWPWMTTLPDLGILFLHVSAHPHKLYNQLIQRMDLPIEEDYLKDQKAHNPPGEKKSDDNQSITAFNSSSSS